MPKLFHNNISFCYEAFGNPQDPCVLFIMGIGGQLIRWPQQIIEGLTQEGFYVVIFDNRDVGLSSYFDHLASPDLFLALEAKHQGKNIEIPYTLDDMADDVIALMNGLKITKAHIAGISMGGMIAQLVAINYPHRVLSLICIATTSGDPDLPPANSEVLDFFTKPKPPVKDLKSYLENMLQIHKIYNPESIFVREELEEVFKNNYERAYNPQGFHRQLLAVIFAEPRGKRLKKIKQPSLIIHGDRDPAFPIEHARQLAQCLPNSHLEIIKRMGHGLPEFMHKKLVDLIAKHSK